MAQEYRNGEYHKGDAPFQFPWWAIALAFFTWGPLGIIFIGANILLRSDTRRPAPPRPAAAGQPGPGPRYAPNAAPPKAAAAPKKEPMSSEKLARILLIAGAVLLGVGLLAVAEPLEYIIADLVAGETYWTIWLEDLIAGLMMTGGGLGAVLAGLTTRTNARMRKKIDNIVGKADHMYIRDIAAAVPCSEEKCCKHLENCIDKGLFGDEAYLDMRTKCLVVRGPAPQPEARARTKAEKTVQTKAVDQYQRILNELRSVNDAIPDDEMSEKISRLEAVSARIFQQAKANPDKLPQMRKFMDYYLPTSLKLLKTYAELDAQGIEGDNIRLSKQRIEQAMDTLVVAFENQLDQLFSADAMDVSADIEVMENMLRADGLAGGASPAAPPGPQLRL